jgi:D-alanyl-D-alanine carboxypeptidase/D-alanyl-D-alanine-endopeptidase (penicillin-binding protein 4)
MLSLVVPLTEASKQSGSRTAKRATSKKSGKRVTKKKSTRRRPTARRMSRKARLRWLRQLAYARAVQHQSKIQNSLTEAWSAAHTAPEFSRPAAAMSGPSSGEAEPAAMSVPREGTPAAAAAKPVDPNAADAADVVLLNPLVAAFQESLEARGHVADNQGFIVETMNGEVLADHNADVPFNPASVVKIATSLVAIARHGPEYRFRTVVYTDGSLDAATQTLNGSIYVVGSGDPAFCYENAMLLADQLNQSGIRTVNGNLVVQGQFYFNFSAARDVSAKSFLKTLSPQSWTKEMTNAYPRFLAMKAAGDSRIAGATEQDSAGSERTRPRVVSPMTNGRPSLTITGETITDGSINTSGLHMLAVHTSLPLVRVLKVLNDYSDNWMAAAIGQLVGGPDSVEQFLQTAVGLKSEETRIVTASGLGTNLISPRGTLQILRKLIAYLEREGLGIHDLLPVAGVDSGTLGRRFTDQFRGSVVAKTGTLGSQGVSALAGVAYTRNKGPLLFVIYNRGRYIPSFRVAQDETIRKVITLYGGPAPLRYSGLSGLRLVGGGGQVPSLSVQK